MSEVIIVNAIQTLWSQGTQPSNYLRFHETTSVSFRFKEQATNRPLTVPLTKVLRPKILVLTIILFYTRIELCLHSYLYFFYNHFHCWIPKKEIDWGKVDPETWYFTPSWLEQGRGLFAQVSLMLLHIFIFM